MLADATSTLWDLGQGGAALLVVLAALSALQQYRGGADPADVEINALLPQEAKVGQASHLVTLAWATGASVPCWCLFS